MLRAEVDSTSDTIEEGMCTPDIPGHLTKFPLRHPFISSAFISFTLMRVVNRF